MGAGVYASIALRRRPVLLALLVLAVASAVYTSLDRGAQYVGEASRIAAGLLRGGPAVQIVEDCVDCLGRACPATLTGPRGSAETYLVLLERPLAGVDPRSLGGGVALGRVLAERLGARPGDRVEVTVGGETLEARVAGVYRSGSALDLYALAGPGLECMASWRLTPGERRPGDFIEAARGDVEGLMGRWRILALAALLLGSALAAAKSALDLEAEARALRAQGGSPRGLAVAVSAGAMLAVLAGSAAGVVVSDAVASMAAGITGAYLPPPPLRAGDLALEALAPAAGAALVALAVGWASWRARGL